MSDQRGVSPVTGLLGRAGHLGQLSRAIEAAVAGHGRLVLLTGEAGIGKTALATEAAVVAERRGARVLWASCWHGEAADIATLLRAPGQAFHAADLVAATGAGQAGRAALGLGADEVLDERSRAEYRARLAELDDDIEEAERWHDPHRAERARDEREALLRELAAATGLAGRARRLGDQSERARKTVTARIRDVIERIEAVHAVLRAGQPAPGDGPAQHGQGDPGQAEERPGRRLAARQACASRRLSRSCLRLEQPGMTGSYPAGVLLSSRTGPLDRYEIGPSHRTG